MAAIEHRSFLLAVAAFSAAPLFSAPPASATPSSPAVTAASAEMPAPVRAPAEIIRRVDTDSMEVAITFDACATKYQGNGFDRPLYRVLQREQIPTTIFVSGRWVESHPRVMEELAADPLIEFANHSYDHRYMTTLSDSEISAQFDRTEAALSRYFQRSVAFRPPFGIFNERVLEIARDKQIPAVLWDVVSGDPSADATTESIVRNVLRDTRSGSIVIFHINGRETQTVFALPIILRDLRERGFQFVHVSKLLAKADAPTFQISTDEDDVMPLAPALAEGSTPMQVIHRPSDGAAGRPSSQ